MARGDPPAVPVQGVPQVSSKPLRKTRIQPANLRRASQDEQQKTTTGGAPKPPDRRQLCEGMLRGGFVQSFVDFFYLTHRPDPEDEGRDVQVPAREAQYLRENLERAEAARRRGDTGAVYAAYANVAKYYEGRAGDAATGVYFYEKCLEVARLTGDHRGEMAAHHDLGLARAAANEGEAAARHHERHLAMARALDDAREARLASRELAGVYTTRAAALEAAGAPAVDARRAALAAARDAGDAGGEAAGGLAFGRAQVASGDPINAVATLESAEALFRKLGDVKAEGRAAAALAAAWRDQGDNAAAAAYLERCLASASASSDFAAEASACRALGALEAAAGDGGRAVELLEKNFDISRKLLATGDADVSTADRARAYLGVVRGNVRLGALVGAVGGNVTALLDWKCSRKPL